MARTVVDMHLASIGGWCYRGTVTTGNETALLIPDACHPKTIKTFGSGNTAVVESSMSTPAEVEAETENSTELHNSTDDFADILYAASTAIIIGASGGSVEVEISG